MSSIRQYAMTTGNRDSSGKVIHRLYTEVVSENDNSVSLRLANGRVISRVRNQVAFYIQTPPDWNELYQQQEISGYRK